MKNLTAILSLLLTFTIFSTSQAQKVAAKFYEVENMGFMSVYVPDKDINNDLLSCFKANQKIVVTAELNGVTISDTTDSFGIAADETGKQIGRSCSIYGANTVIRYYDKAKVEYELPLGRTDLQTFGRKAKWTVRPL